MKKIGTIFLAVVASILLVSVTARAWDPLGLNNLHGDIDAARADFNKQIAETRKTVAESIDMISKTMPGERYMRLIDDLNSNDKDKVQAAQTFLEKLAHIDIKAKYLAIVAYDFDDKQPSAAPFMADFNLFSAPSATLLQAYIDDHSISMHPPARIVLSPLTEDQVRDQIKENVIKSLDEIFGAPSYDFFPGPYMNGGTLRRSYPNVFFKTVEIPKGGYTPVAEGSLRTEFNAWLVGKHEAISGFMADAIMAAYQYRETRMKASKERRSFDPMLEKNYVIVLLDEQTFRSHEEWTIKITIEKDGQPEQTLNDRPIYTMHKSDFDPEKQKLNPVVTGANGIRYYWAYHEVTGDPTLSAAQVQAVRDVRERLKVWAAERTD